MSKVLDALAVGDFGDLTKKYSDILLAGLVVGVVGMMIVPLPTFLLDLLLVTNITITELRDSTFYAEICIANGGKEYLVDARPSDSVALAVRANCPILVSDEVFKACPELLKPISEEKVTDFRKKLEHMTPEDFFKDLKKKDKDEGGPSTPPEKD